MFHQRLVLFIFGFTIWVGIAAPVNLALDINAPFGGYLESYNALVGRFSYNRATPPWWPNVTTDGRTGWDENPVIEINGFRNDHNLNKRLLYYNLFHSGVSSITFTLESPGGNSSVISPIYEFSFLRYMDVVVPDLIIGLSFLVIAWAVFQAEQSSGLNRSFAIACLVVAMSRWLSVVTIFPFSTIMTYILDFIATAIVNPFFGVVLLHFALHFPEKSKLLHSTFLKALYTIGVAIAVSWGLSRLLLWLFGFSEIVQALDKFSFYLSLRVFATSLAFLFLRIVVWYIRGYHDRRVRHQGLWLICGFLVGLPFPFIQVLDGFGISFAAILNRPDWRYTMLVFPLIFGILILRYRSFQPVPAQFLIVVIVATSGLLASLVESTSRQLYTFLQETARVVVFLPLFGLLSVNALVWAFQGHWQGFFGRLLHWEQRSFMAVSRFAQQMSTTMDWDGLPERIVAIVKKEIEVNYVSLWNYDTETTSLTRLAHTDESIEIVSEPIPEVALKYSNVYHVGQLSGKLHSLVFPAELVVPLHINENLLGILTLGKRWDDEIFEQRDREILTLLGHQIGVLLLARDHVMTVRHIPEKVALAQEHERLKIARELHDTIQQFLGRLPFFLEVSRSDVFIQPRATQELLSRVMQDVEKASKTLRQIQYNLTLSELELGIEFPLRKLVQDYTSFTNIPITFECNGNLDEQSTVSIRQTIYRVVQQSLDNVIEHSAATLVKINTTCMDGHISISITDNGRGFDSRMRTMAQQSGSFGLLSIEGRVASIGGKCEIISKKDMGTKITISIPLNHLYDTK